MASSVDLRRIEPYEVVLGEVLPWPLYDAKGILLLDRGQVISSRRHLEALLLSGLYRGPDAPPARAAEPPAYLGREDCPFDLIAQIPPRLGRTLDGLRQGHREYQSYLQRLAHEIQYLCGNHPDAALGAVHLFHDHHYPLVHLLHTAILCDVIARRVGYRPERRIPLLCAALTSNISILELQDELHQQADPLTDAQRMQIENHPQDSVAILREAGVSGELWLQTILQHHERVDGQGYLRALRGEQILADARIVALADIYSAMVTPRSYREARPAKEALRELFLARGREVDERLSEQFIKELGVYPPGAFVELNNGERGIVIRRGRNYSHPTVSVLTRADGHCYAHPLRRCCDTGEYAIRRAIPEPLNMPLNLRLVWHYGTGLNPGDDAGRGAA